MAERINNDNGTVMIRVSYRDENNKKRYKSSTWKPGPNDKTDTQKKKSLDKFELDWENRVKNDLLMKGENTTFAEFAEIYKTDHIGNKAINTNNRDTGIIDSIFLPKLGHLKLSDIRPKHINGIFKEMHENGFASGGGTGKVKKYKSYDRHYAVIRGLLNKAVKWNYITDNPALRIELPAIELTEDDIDLENPFANFEEEQVFTVEQAKSFFRFMEEQNIPLQLQAFFYISLFAGTRRGETLALTWNDINFNTGFIAVIKTIINPPGGQELQLKGKTKKSSRVIYLAPMVIDVLKVLKNEQEQYRQSCGTYWQGNDKLPWIFISDNGTWMDYDRPYREFNAILTKYNSAHPEHSLPNITPHQLRHSATSIASDQEVDLKTISGFLGHSNIRTTEIYHHPNRYNKTVGTAMQKAFGGSGTANGTPD